MDIRETLKFIISGSEVERYHTIRTLQTETVGHHSHSVAMLCHLIDPAAGKGLIIAALTHDLAEFLMGDIPSPAKRRYGIGDTVNVLEKQLLREVGLNFELTDKEVRTLKLADIFQGMLFCMREMELGNLRMGTIFNRYKSYAEQMHPVGVEGNIFDAIIQFYRRGKIE